MIETDNKDCPVCDTINDRHPAKEVMGSGGGEFDQSFAPVTQEEQQCSEHIEEWGV